MRRETFRATIQRDGAIIGETTKYAFNSAIRATEALVRELARSEGQMYTGGATSSTGERYNRETYARTWTALVTGSTVIASVQKLQAQA